MATQIQLRRGDSTLWTSSNPTLAEGELGLELDTGRVKIGDGTTAWNSLGYSLDVEISAIVGSRTYTEQNYVTNGETVTASIDAIDTTVASHLADGTQHGKSSRFVVGTSTAGWTSSDCDHLCDGTADDVEINAAITALPASGGEIVILDGTYNITAKIDVTKDNVSIKGNGNATTLKRMYDSSTEEEGVITLTGRSGCKISNLQVDGNNVIYDHYNNYGIFLADLSNNNTVAGNTCNNSNSGIYLSNSSSNNSITGNSCNNNSYSGIGLYDSSNNNTVTGNACNNNYSGIYLEYLVNNNTVTGNTCNNNDYHGIFLVDLSNNSVTGNTCNNNNDCGIFLDDSSNNNTVTGNNCNNNYSGIYLEDSSNNTVTGNTCIRGTGLPTDYTAGQDTIRLYSTGNSYNLISNNNCMGKALRDGGGTGNTLVNNKFDAT